MNPYELFIDYDGVLVAFDKKVHNLFGRYYADSHYNTEEKREERNKAISKHPGFWESLEPMHDYDHLWNHVQPFEPHILTAYAQWDEMNSILGKYDWNRKYTQVPLHRFHVVRRSEKQVFAKTPEGKPCVLVDDFDRNIKEWEEKGGIGVLHTDAFSTIEKLKDLGFTYDR